MEIRKIRKEELPKLVELYKEAFPIHSIFNKSEEEILQYLKEIEGTILVAVEGDDIAAVLVLVKKHYGHNFGLIRHFAVSIRHRRKGIGSKLLKHAEEIIKKGKIEMRVVCPIAKRFYEKNGYEVEGELKSHYRPEETCYVMGKLLEG